MLGERHTPGVGEVTQLESIRKEVVQLLCVENMSNSKLTNSISFDVASRENSLEKVVQTVAVFKKPPAGAGRATYELKPEFYDEYDVFYYHYNKVLILIDQNAKFSILRLREFKFCRLKTTNQEEQSKSEQNMRKRRKDAGHPECNPPPVVPHFAKGFSKVVLLIQIIY